MSVYSETKENSLPESSEEDVSPQYLQNQSEFFSKLKQFLLTQQETLRQNLENAKQKSKVSNLLEITRNDPGTNLATAAADGGDTSASAQSSKTETLPKQKYEIQICPVCGLEFEGGPNPVDFDALELHVAEHWCSPSSE